MPRHGDYLSTLDSVAIERKRHVLLTSLQGTRVPRSDIANGDVLIDNDISVEALSEARYSYRALIAANDIC